MFSRFIGASAIAIVQLMIFAGCAAEQTASEPAHASHAASTTQTPTPTPKDFSIEGFYAEACSCTPPCPCELTGPNMSCKGVGAYDFTKGSYGGEDFSGTRVAYSLYIGDKVEIYIDAPNAAKRATAEKFMRQALAGFGPIHGVKDAKVELSGHDGAYTMKVDGGKVMTCTTEPVLGGDKKTPIVHSNTFDALNPVMYQAVCTACTYSDGDMQVALDKGRNSYFNQHMKTSGKL